MVLTSDQVSAMTAGFQAQSLMSMQHAAMISQQAGMPLSEAAMGGLVNRGAAIGHPLLSAGAGLLGLDPFSMGMRGAMAGARFGIGGAVGGGVIGAGAVGVPIMAAGYAGSQMMTGMQEQQMLNSQLRGSYNFSTTQGRGFTQGDMGQIGQVLRNLTDMRGPGGEMTSFDELGRMASSMGRMGMAQGVQNARDFNEKFTQMLKSVKEIATAFHTSLEEAQQIMGSMKSSGIFRNQGAVANQIRGFAVGANIATSEITSMMGIGSQISRSIGGRGLAGAMGGMTTIGQVGLAQRFGTLSEEDVYNATGLTGAEGRQAMSMQMMQSSAQFLRGGLGRRFLASVAGKDGTLDESSVAEYMYGGVGTDRTMAMAGQNLGRVGRANFIRNEGRLRGEALGRFGGLTNVIAMRGWLEQRGFDLSSGQDDRAQIFLQRRLGIGNDEAENMVKMARDLPMLMKGQQNTMEEANFNQSIDTARQNSGLAGVKKQIESAKDKVNNYLRQAGADFYQSGSNLLERWVNSLTGAYFQDISTDIIPAIRTAMSGGSMGDEALASRFGLKGFGKGLVGQNYFDRFRGNVFGGIKGFDPKSFRDSGAADRYAAAGYSIDSSSSSSIEAGLKSARDLLGSYRSGSAEGVGSREFAAYEGIGKEYSGEILRRASLGAFKGRGRDRIANFQKAMEGVEGGGLNIIGIGSNSTLSQNQQAAIMGAVMKGAGLGGFDSEFMGMPEDQFLFTDGAFRTEKDRNSAVGEYMLRGSNNARAAAKEADRAKARRERVGEGTLSWMGRQFTDAWKQAFSDTKGYLSDRSSQISEAAGGFIMSEKGQQLSRDVLSNDSMTSSATLRQIQMRNVSLLSRANKRMGAGRFFASGDDNLDSMNDTERGEFEANNSMQMAADFARVLEEKGGNLSDDDKKALAEKWTNGNWEDFEQRASTVMAGVAQKQKLDQRPLFKRIGEKGVALRESFERAGISGGKVGMAYDVGKKRGYKAGDLEAFGSTSSGRRYLSMMARQAQEMSEVTEMSSEEDATRHLRAAKMYEQAGSRELGDMSVKEKRQLASVLRQQGGPEEARSALLETAAIREKLEKGGKKGAGKAIADLLGVSLDKDQMKGLGGSSEEIANIIGGSAFGSMSKGVQADLTKAIELSRSGKAGEAESLIRDLQSKAADSRRDREEKEKDQNDPGFKRLGEIKTSLDNIGKSMAGTLKVQVIGPVQTEEKAAE